MLRNARRDFIVAAILTTAVGMTQAATVLTGGSQGLGTLWFRWLFGW